MRPTISVVLFAALVVGGCTSSRAAAPLDSQSRDSLPVAETDPAGSKTSSEVHTAEDEEVPYEGSSYEGSPYEVAPYDRSYDAADLYGAMCAACHGEDGDGNAPIPDAFSFATTAALWTNGPTVDGILLTLEDGIHHSAMRSFPEYQDFDRVALAEYILDLRRALAVDEEDEI